MKAIILAAGKGTRMGPLTGDRPKCMLDFLGRTLLERQLALFKSCAFRDIIVVTGHKAAKITYDGIVKVENTNYNTTNMIESLFRTRHLWDEDIMVSYGDIVYEKKVLRKVMKSKGDIEVAVDLNGLAYFKERFGMEFLSKIESLVMNDDNLILDIGRASPALSRIHGQYIGLMKFSKKGLAKISNIYDKDKANFRNAFMTDMLQRLIDEGNEVGAVKVKGGWLEFDSSSDYEKYIILYKNGRLDTYFRDIAV